MSRSFFAQVAAASIIASAGICSWSSSAQAQETAPAQVTAPAPAAAPLVRNEGETVGDFLGRLQAADPLTLSDKVAALFVNDPTVFPDLAGLATNPETSQTLIVEILKGMTVAADREPVKLAGSVSAFALADPANTATLISMTREANAIPLDEVFGEGLALAASTLKTSGDNILLAASIQSQATSREAPVALSEAFLDNLLLTAAGRQAGGAGAGGAADITGNNPSPLPTGGVGSALNGVTQTAGVTAPSGVSYFSAATTNFRTSTSPTEQP